MANSGADKAVEEMDKFHAYLESNYIGGSERFFSPTGFLDDFQRSVELQVADQRKHVLVNSIDKAVETLEPLIAGSEGVFDLSAEPGTGKTSVLPFKFPTKKVMVALPTPFDAWSAYNMATGDARLHLKGLRMGNKMARVTYTDSYSAAKAVLSNYLDYDIMIVDECDSPRGVTRFLAEVRTRGKFVIRMSASHGTTTTGPSRSFLVTESDKLPDIRESTQAVADFVVKHRTERSLLLVPDADSALSLGALLKDSKVVCTKSRLGDIARAIVNQHGPRLFVADDTCARGLNLNITSLFDTQLVAEFGSVRSLTSAELLQRKGRVGRNKNGSYFSPGLKCVEAFDSDIDIVRHNVVRSLATLRQLGSAGLRLTEDEGLKLMCSDVEPFQGVTALRVAGSDIIKSPVFSERYETAVGSSSSGSTSSKVVVRPPQWMSYFGNRDMSGKPTDQVWISKDKKGRPAFMRRKDSAGSGSKSNSGSGSNDSALTGLGLGMGKVALRNPGQVRKALPVVEDAPYAVDSSAKPFRPKGLSVPMSPPVMDLTEMTYNMNWPGLIRDRLQVGGDLPTLVPTGSWRHTSVGGIGNNWIARLEALAVADAQFSDSEFEVVCRAWNLLVNQAWIKRTPGLSHYSNHDKLEYCARYFQSYFLLQETEQDAE